MHNIYSQYVSQSTATCFIPRKSRILHAKLTKLIKFQFLSIVQSPTTQQCTMNCGKTSILIIANYLTHLQRFYVFNLFVVWNNHLHKCFHLHGYTVHQWYQNFSSPTNALVEFIKTRLKLGRLLQHVSVYKETIIREQVSA